jgi:hypothetical protein
VISNSSRRGHEGSTRTRERIEVRRHSKTVERCAGAPCPARSGDEIRTHSTPSPPHLVDGPAPGHAEGQGTGELDEANDLAHQCVLVTTTNSRVPSATSMPTAPKM